jgi:hypothetical protein
MNYKLVRKWVILTGQRCNFTREKDLYREKTLCDGSLELEGFVTLVVITAKRGGYGE